MLATLLQQMRLLTTNTENTSADTILLDEFCYANDFLDNLAEDDSPSPVKEIVLETTCEEILEEEEMKDLLEYNLKILGINLLEAKAGKSESGLISITVIIQPTSKEIIARLSLALENWNLKTMPR